MKKKTTLLAISTFLLFGLAIVGCDDKPEIKPNEAEVRNTENNNSEKNDSTKTNSTVNGWETVKEEDVNLTIKPAK